MTAPCWLVDLSSDLRLEEVLDRVIQNAAQAFPGREFALLVVVGDELTAVRTTGLGPGVRRRIEAWAQDDADVLAEPRAVRELAADPELERLALRLGVGEMRSEPLLFKERSLGILVGLAPGLEPFGTGEADLLRQFAEQAAVALGNAHMFQGMLERATHDSLTGLPNRRHFERALAHELDRSARYGEIFSLAMIDLDGFKALNDGRGHAAGDTVLRQAAQTIDDACRGADIPARIGGDEFVLVLPETNQYEAAALCERLRAEIETLTSDISLSWGVAEYPTHGTDGPALKRAADAAMYASKPRVVGGERASAT